MVVQYNKRSKYKLSIQRLYAKNLDDPIEEDVEPSDGDNDEAPAVE